MIVTAKSTVGVSVDITDLSIKSEIFCEISNYIQTSENYGANGLYYYMKEIPPPSEGLEPTFQKVPLKGFTAYYTIEEINALYEDVDPHYPSGSSYNEKNVIDVTDGLKYELTVNPEFGLTGNQWVIV